MLTIVVPGTETWNDKTERFVVTQGQTLELEHSLVSLSEWEARFEKPFLSNEKKSVEETYGYIQCMSKEPVAMEVLACLTDDNVKDINKYIESKHSATWFKEVPGGPKSREIITAEIIYHWMFAMQIDLDCQNWHLARLFTLIKVISEKNQKPKKMSKAEAIAQQRQLNAERLARSGGNG